MKWKCFNAFKENITFVFDDIINDDTYKKVSQRNQKWFVPIAESIPLSDHGDVWTRVNDDVPKEKYLLLFNGNWIGVGRCFMVDDIQNEEDTGVLVTNW